MGIRRNTFLDGTESKVGTKNNITGTLAIPKTPNNLFGINRNKLKVGKKYHSGKISKGVAKGSAASPIKAGSSTDNPIYKLKVPIITTGKIYNKSSGHAGSPNDENPILFFVLE